MNEILLTLSLLFSFFSVLFFYKYFGKSGLFIWICISSIFANIEVCILINAFGMEQTLGNMLFASSFLATDILSEIYDKQTAKKGVHIGILCTFTFIFFSIIWTKYIPSANDWAMPSINNIFSKTPRILFFSLASYIISQYIDVILYHKIWNFTSKKTGNNSKFLWLRNNTSTLISQLINIIIFNFGSFWNIYKINELINLTLSCYIIYIVTSLLDTPFIYLSKKIQPKN